ncbi:hypothetical protein [Desulforhopalus sp. 52FAK]
MPKDSIYPPGDKIIKAVKEYSEELSLQGKEKQKNILEKIMLKYDLSPKECEFLHKHFRD